MSRPLTFALLGVDGSGKTTQARLLVDWLRSRDLPAQYYENPGGRPVTDALARAFHRGDTAGLLGARGRVVAETAIRMTALLRASVLARLTSQVAVLDRCAYCQYALIRARGDRGDRLCRVVLGRFRAPDLTLLLHLTPEVAETRVRLRGRDREEQSHLAAFQDSYERLPEAASFHRIDAVGTAEQVHRRVQAAVLLLLPSLETRGRQEPGPYSDG